MVVGKDIVPRIGLHQLERLRHQLMETLQASTQPKVSRNCLREIIVELKRYLKMKTGYQYIYTYQQYQSIFLSKSFYKCVLKYIHFGRQSRENLNLG